jgi:hypothetical protein
VRCSKIGSSLRYTGRDGSLLGEAALDPKPSFATGRHAEAAFSGVTQGDVSFQSRRQGRPAVTSSSVNSGDDQVFVTRWRVSINAKIAS